MQRNGRWQQARQERYSWREYQVLSNQSVSRGGFFKRILTVGGVAILLTGLFYQTTGGDTDSLKLAAKSNSPSPIRKSDVKKLLAGKQVVNLENKSFNVAFQGQTYRVDTSLDISLQQFLQKKLKRSTSRYIGIVAMDPTTGRILSMIGYDKSDTLNNPCADNRFPAASIFKIVTAAAVVEQRGLNPSSEMTYNGNKYTLYRSQLKDRRHRYTRRISLRDSFAQSVNPVFGKIGARDLGKTILEKYATAFGFNREIAFELPLTPSVFSISDEPYRWAEIASGFNRETTLSPIHGALLAATVMNQGKLIEPTVIEKITDKKGRAVYHSDLVTVNQAITPEASDVIYQLMRATIRSGTSKKAFRGYRRDRVLSKLNIGGKTGSINNKKQDARFDWFVGFAEEKDGPEKLVISVVVAHEKYIGIRASRYARIAIKHYFRDYFLKQVAASDKDGKSS